MVNIYSWTTGEPIYLFGSLRVYPFTMLIGIIASILSVLYFWKKNKFPIDILLVLIIITIPTALIGARLFWIIERAINNESLDKWYAIWDGGLSIHGGVFLPAIFDLLYIQRKKNVIDVRKVFGVILPSVLLGQAIGRWGNFTNHEIYGAVCSYDSIAWLGNGIAWNMYIDNEFRIPLFLIESFTSFIGYFVIVWWLLQFDKLRPGTTGALYLVWYGVIRIIMEPFRTAEDFEYWYLVLSALSIVTGLFLVWYFETTGKKIYEKYRISKYSNYFYNTKIQIAPANLSTRWINE